jgi:hypothetical protein
MLLIDVVVIFAGQNFSARSSVSVILGGRRTICLLLTTTNERNIKKCDSKMMDGVMTSEVDVVSPMHRQQ